MKYGKLTFVKKIRRPYGKNRIVHIFGLFTCDCGEPTEKHYKSVLKGKITSCGCDKIHKKRPILNHFYGTRIYSIWNKMKDRCSNPNNNYYYRYGGRGIKVCEEWIKSSISFCEWALKNGYKDNLTIERDDVNGNYEPSNCRWIKKADQMKNTSRSVFVTHNGKTMCLKDWSIENGINYFSVRHRVRSGWDIIDAITIPTKVYNINAT